MNRAWLLFLFITTLVGCATTDSPRTSRSWLAAVNPARSENDRLLDYYRRVTQLKPPEIGREYENVKKVFENQPNDSRRIQLSMLLSMPGTTFRDDTAALALLQSWTRDKRNDESALRPLAAMIQSYLQDLRRTDDALQTQSSKLRDEQRRAEALQQKLEALLEMEMKMIEREQAAQPKKR